ncbi:MAG: insulinase family protein [Deltaproteobacteria bacterium]|nr:MAG: insulinase family protein [Deltaproteobacteria bacterium]
MFALSLRPQRPLKHRSHRRLGAFAMLLAGALFLPSLVWSAPTTQKTQSAPKDAGAQLRQRVVEVKLKNGMTFLLVRRQGAPTFTAYLRVKAGGVDENIGYTGLAHIFEHMAFKGTTVVGSRNWPKEKALLHELNRVGDALSLAMVRSRGKETLAIKLLKKRLKDLQTKHKRMVKTDEFTKLYQANGGTGLNATTGKDLTSYFISLPANRLALWAHQEASRLAAPVFREFYRERAVVAEERRMAMSRGGGRLYEKFIATAFVAHPYRFPTVGWMSDITTIPLSSVRDFFKQYYAPSNMVGAIVGNIDIAKATAVLKATFGKIPAGSPPPSVRTVEPKQEGERRVKVEFHTNPQLMIGFHKPTAPHFHDDVFDVIEALLTSGSSSRLYKALVKTRKAQSVWASSLPGSRFPNVFTLGATPIAPNTTKQIEAIIYKELERLKKKPVSARELKKVRNQMSMSFVRNLRSNKGLAAQLSYFQALLGDWRYATHFNARLKKVTPQAIMEVAKQYFRRSNRTVATLKKVEAKAKSMKKRRAPQAHKAKPASRPLAGAPTTQQIKTDKAKQKALAQVRTLLAEIQNTTSVVRPLPKGLQRHPKFLKFKPLKFVPPRPSIIKLANGITVYLLQDRELPLVDMFALVKTGRLYDPLDKIGLAEITGTVMRTGGFSQMKGDILDEALDFRGAKLSSSISSEMGSASLSVHRRDLDWGMKAFASMLRYPRFPKNKIKLYKARMLERYRRRNDNPFRLALRYFKKAVYGNNRWSMYPTPKSIKAITRKDLFSFHHNYYRPSHLRLAVVGDFNKKDLLKKLNRYFGTWKGKPKPLPPIAKLKPRKSSTVTVIQRPIPQSIILVGHLGPKRHHPQWLAGQMMNHILGGGGFGSRLMTEIRTRRGLAYFAGSQIASGPDRGLFVAYTGTQPPTTGKALRAMLNILKQMQKTGKVSQKELELTRKTFLNRFIFLFQSPAQIVYRQAYYDYFNFPKNFLSTYRKRLVSITPKEVAAAAKTFIRPDEFAILVIGYEPMFDKPELSTFGKVVRIPLRK